MEMAEPWKAWKAKGRLSPPPPTPWKSRTLREISTFPQPRRSGMEKWKTKSRFPTFPFRFATTTPVLSLPNPTAYGRQSRRFAAHRTPSWSPDSNFTPNGKEFIPGIQRLRFSGSSCIGNESRFQDHLSIWNMLRCCGHRRVKWPIKGGGMVEEGRACPARPTAAKAEGRRAETSY